MRVKYRTSSLQMDVPDFSDVNSQSLAGLNKTEVYIQVPHTVTEVFFN